MALVPESAVTVPESLITIPESAWCALVIPNHCRHIVLFSPFPGRGHAGTEDYHATTQRDFASQTPDRTQPPRISAALDLSKGVVNKYISRARAKSVGWPLPKGMDEAAPERLLFPAPLLPGRGAEPKRRQSRCSAKIQSYQNAPA